MINQSKLATGALAGLLLSACGAVEAEPTAEALPPLGPDGLAFSIDNMDTSVDPADDFTRYAIGGWLDRVERPADKSSLTFLGIIGDRIDEQVAAVVTLASANAADAEPGTPMQQVGTLYNAYMDVEAIEAAGLETLQPEIDRLAAVESEEDFAEYLAHYTMITGQWPIIEMEVFGGLDDVSVNQPFFQPGALGLEVNAIHEAPAGSPLKQMYGDYIAGLLTRAGYEEDAAAEIATTSMAIESALYQGHMDPVLKVDYRNWNNPRTREELQAALPTFPLDTYWEGLGLEVPDTLVVTEPDYPAAVAGVFRDYSIDQLKDYLAYRLIQRFAGALPTTFAEPGYALNSAFMGTEAPVPPREETAIQAVKTMLAQPMGRVYVENYFDEEAQARGIDMIERIQAAFRSRLEDNDWLSDETRAQALTKVDNFYYAMGIPDRWVDYSSVEIGDDMVQNIMNLSRFEVQRSMATSQQPVEIWAFSDAAHTAPTVVNAAYNAGDNGFQVTAGISQPPTFDPSMDAAVNFCRLGAVIGHEMTHGFDSGGRSFDADGNMRNWWTDPDAARFDSEAAKLVDQAGRYEALPGTFVNGGLTVKENMADVGGITFAYRALMDYLEEHPEENVEIDGFTPTQRCFIAWAQLWAEKSTEQAIGLQLQDNHPPGMYRTYAPLQHLSAFYDAFGIEEGDPMWLPPEERVQAW